MRPDSSITAQPVHQLVIGGRAHGQNHPVESVSVLEVAQIISDGKNVGIASASADDAVMSQCHRTAHNLQRSTRLSSEFVEVLVQHRPIARRGHGAAGGNVTHWLCGRFVVKSLRELLQCVSIVKPYGLRQ